MTSIISKRHQARNERALQDLIRNVPGNDRCADCSARNPGWASWSLGIFLCMRCAALHRKLGTHLSKVKSLSMDAWNSEQVENMKKIGNTTSNKQYNQRNIKPEMPLDPDEIDMAMEKFIRQKYQHRTLGEPTLRAANRQNTGSTSSEDQPPPLPPKPTQRFAPSLRAVSSTLSRRKERPLPPINTSETRRGSFEEKMHALKEMGFPDEKRNATVLRGLDGNVEKSVEALIKLGEKTRKDKAVTSSQSKTSGPSTATRGSARTASSAPISSMQEPSSASSQSVSTAGAFVQSQPAPQNNSFNPFDPSYQANHTPSTPLEATFQNLHVAPQPLFPNHTGNWQQQTQHNPFYKNYTPPISPVQYQQLSPSAQTMFFGPANGQGQPMSAQSTGSNPFLRTSKSQTFSPSNPYNQQQQPPFGYASPLGQPVDPSLPPVPPLPSWTQNVRSTSQPLLPLAPVQHMQAFSVNRMDSPPSLQSPFHEPAFRSPQSYEHQTAAEYPFYPQHFPQQQSQGQLQQPTQNTFPTGKFDKNSILALYNQPRRESQQPPPTAADNATAATNAGQQFQQPLRSATLPASNSNSAAQDSLNPFANLAARSVNGTGARPSRTMGYGSRESVDFASLMAGRHSPDAFASLSARYG